MANPFEKRATEYLRDETAFLSVVVPEPLNLYFKKHAESGALFDRLCMIIGNPGSGKTTLASLLQYKNVYTLVHSPNHTEYRPLVKALNDCKVIDNNEIKILACRIPMESQFREFWELPYENEVKTRLIKSFLQSKAIILWLQSLKDTGNFDLSVTAIKYREGGTVVSDSIGGDNAEDILDHAKKIEKAIYSVSAALIPPPLNELSPIITAPYHPFDAIELIEAKNGLLTNNFIPLVILDDFHSLHSEQIVSIQDWLARREIKIARWLMLRLDVQTPENIIDGIAIKESADSQSTIKKSREITDIWLQSSTQNRRDSRTQFRTMAKNMADKYLGLMPLFSNQGIRSFQNILSTDVSNMSETKHQELLKKINSLQKKYGINNEVKEQYKKEVEDFVKSSTGAGMTRDIKLAMLLILLNRYVIRTPQKTFFELDGDVEPSKPIKANSGVANGAKLFLMHEFDQPYYFGIDIVCDGSSENAEQFLQLAGELVNASEKQIIKGKSPILGAKYQHNLLLNKAKSVVNDWNFPMHEEVRTLCSKIADDCIKKSLEPNASLNAGANAIGIPDEEFRSITKKHQKLAEVIKFGIAYGAISIKPNHKTKNKMWTLIELSGPYLISQRLTFSRGGFLEKNLSYLNSTFRSRNE